jgi:hypothetical protein
MSPAEHERDPGVHPCMQASGFKLCTRIARNKFLGDGNFEARAKVLFARAAVSERGRSGDFLICPRSSTRFFVRTSGDRNPRI